MKTRKHNKLLVFYTCFFGTDDHDANIIPKVPSSKYKCYYFTNNKTTLNRVDGWIPIFINTPIKMTNRDNAMDSKELKACPHHFKELQGYKYTCYFDTKLKIRESDVLKNIRSLHHHKMMVNKHPLLEPYIWDEFNEAMKQPRYYIDKPKYISYIHEQLNNGLKESVQHHYETSYILRESSTIVNKLGEAWYKDIQRTGIECQISFFFIQQLFPNVITPTKQSYKRNKTVKQRSRFEL
jgi:hypothetical protein